MIIIAIDPGPTQPGTTGVAIRTDDGYMTCAYFDAKDVYELFDTTKYDACIIEFFTTSGRISRHGLGTVELVGAVTALCAMKKIPLYRQAPFYRKPWLAEAKRIAGKGVVIHEIDALAHLLSWEWARRRTT